MKHSGPVFGIATASTKDTIAPHVLGPWAEANGFESLWFGEHSHIPVGLQSKRRNYKEIPEAFKELYDPLIALMSVAAATKTLKLGTSVLIVTEHHPIRLAKMLSTLDRISGGRVIMAWYSRTGGNGFANVCSGCARSGAMRLPSSTERWSNSRRCGVVPSLPKALGCAY